MTSHASFMARLVTELQTEDIFSNCEVDHVGSSVPEPLVLARVADGPVGYYRYDALIPLRLRVNDELLEGASAQLTLRFTSASREFDYERAMDVDSSGAGEGVHAVNAVLQVQDNRGVHILECRKTLWSAAPARLEGYLPHVRLLL